MNDRPTAVAAILFLYAILPMSEAPSAAAGADKPPQWLVAEAARSLPVLPPDTPAVVLLDEQATIISPKGILTTTRRLATRVLRPGGIESARRLVTAEAYDTKVKSMNGWVINPSGSPRQVNLKDVISSSLAPDTLY